MIQSMTGYAAQQGEGHGYRWSWELRSVNAKGLDLRLRVPDWIDGLDAATRAALGKAAARGSVTLNLRVQREDTDGAMRLNTSQLDTVIKAMTEIETRAMDAGLSLAPSTAAEVIGLRGILEQGSDADTSGPLKTALLGELPDLIAEFTEMRAREGAALKNVLDGQLTEIARLTEAAVNILDTRKDAMADNLRRNLAKVLDAGDLDEGRIAQELAMIVVKTDVTEEVDRLRAHVVAARELVDTGGAVGRKLDFMMQEFNREANTLCSKAQMSALTEIGLALKVVIDQMREQVQNVE